VAAKFLCALLAKPPAKRLLSNDHLSVGDTLIEAWASLMSFTARGRGEAKGTDDPTSGHGSRIREADLHGVKRSNDTHVSTGDPDAELYRKGAGKEAKL
jgi:hypothetical protein